VPCWTASTDAFWAQTLARLEGERKTILVGTRIPEPAASAGALPDFSTSLAVLRGDLPTTNVRIYRPRDEFVWCPRYINAIVIRGSHLAIVQQRIPVPVAMWNPFRQDSAQLNLSGAGTAPDGKGTTRSRHLLRATHCLTVLMTMMQHPTVLVAAANDYWAVCTGTPPERTPAWSGGRATNYSR
jgi:hypothetical protein